MSNQKDQAPYLKTIANSHWFLLIFILAFAVSLYWQEPSMVVCLIGLVVGIYNCAIHLLAWRYQNDFLSLFLFFIPAIVFASIFQLNGLQTILIGLVVATFIWTIFRQRALRYVVGRT